MGGLVVTLFLIALALLAPRYGVDLRDASDWRPHRDRSLAARGARYTPKGDALALGRWCARMGGHLGRVWRNQERAWGALWLAYQPWRGGEPPTRLEDSPQRRVREPGAGERGRHRDELRWRCYGEAWYLVGRLLPITPAVEDSLGDRPAHRD